MSAPRNQNQLDLSDLLGRLKPSTPSEQHLAVLAVCSNAQDVTEARELLAMIGLDEIAVSA